jgi:ATP-dependent protease ClpP protease subunit
MSARTKSRIPEIAIVDDLEKCEKEVLEALLAIPDGGACRIVINSGGGSVYAGLGIATLIRLKRLEATAVVLADCSSSAVLVFAACPIRQVAPHASLLFHPMQWSSEERSRLSGATGWAREFKRIDEVCAEWICSNLELSPLVYKKWVNREIYVTAGQLVGMGLATYIPGIPAPDSEENQPSRRRRKSQETPRVRRARILPAARRGRTRR